MFSHFKGNQFGNMMPEAIESSIGKITSWNFTLNVHIELGFVFVQSAHTIIYVIKD